VIQVYAGWVEAIPSTEAGTHTAASIILFKEVDRDLVDLDLDLDYTVHQSCIWYNMCIWCTVRHSLPGVAKTLTVIVCDQSVLWCSARHCTWPTVRCEEYRPGCAHDVLVLIL
jgi:hypothetical protein